MALKHTYSLSVRSDTGGGVSSTWQYSAGSETNINDTVTAGATVEYDVPVDVSTIVSMFMYSTKDVSVKTNSNVSPTQTLSLLAKKATSWNTDSAATNPLTNDVTKFYVHNAGADDAAINFSFLLDSTP